MRREFIRHPPSSAARQCQLIHKASGKKITVTALRLQPMFCALDLTKSEFYEITYNTNALAPAVENYTLDPQVQKKLTLHL